MAELTVGIATKLKFFYLKMLEDDKLTFDEKLKVAEKLEEFIQNEDE